LGIGSKRLAGTGRTAGIRAKKLEQQGVADSAAQAKTYLVGGGGLLNSNSRLNSADHGEMLFLKNALGHEMQFSVERGSGARAQLLASKQFRQRYRKLLDAAAIRVGANLPYHLRVEEERKRKIAAAAAQKLAESTNGRTITVGSTLHFLEDNIGRNLLESQSGKRESIGIDAVVDTPDEEMNEPDLVLADDTEELRQLTDEARMAAFQSQYQVEVGRQAQMLHLEATESLFFKGSPSHRTIVDDETVISWEDGEDS
jgi:hypothetical protein